MKKVEQANALFMGLMARGLAAPSPEAVQVAPPPAQPRQQAKAQRGGKGRR